MTVLNDLHYRRTEWCVNRETLEFIDFRPPILVIVDIASRFYAVSRHHRRSRKILIEFPRGDTVNVDRIGGDLKKCNENQCQSQLCAISQNQAPDAWTGRARRRSCIIAVFIRSSASMPVDAAEEKTVRYRRRTTRNRRLTGTGICLRRSFSFGVSPGTHPIFAGLTFRLDRSCRSKRRLWHRNVF